MNLGRDSKGKRWEDYDTIKCLDGTIIDMNKLIQEQARAKAALIHLEPMFSSFANQLHTVYTFHIKTQATDGYHYFVNPQFTAEMTFEEKVFVMAHECMHCVLNHMRRGKQAGHNPKKSNIAADYEVNQTLVDLELFKESTVKKLRGLIDKKYSGWAYERIYDDNPSGPSDDNNNSQGNGGGDKGEQGDQQQGGGSNSGDRQQQQRGSGSSGGSDEQGEKKDGQSGGGSDGDKQNGQNGQGGQGEVTPQDCAGQYGDNMPSTPGGMMSTEEGNELAKAEGYEDSPMTDDTVASAWKEIAIKEAQKDNRTDKHGGKANFFSKILNLWKTSTDWKKEFKNVIGHALNPLSQRQAFANKNVLVSRGDISRTNKDQFDAIDFMTIFIDSSGSISDKMLQYMLSEIYAIALKKKPITLALIQLDTEARDVQIFHSLKDFQRAAKVMTVKGRGGNNQSKCWEFLKNDKRFKGKQSELVIMFTDGWLDQHKRDPKTMGYLCWAIVDNPAFKIEYPDPRTKTIYLDSNKIK